MGSIPGFHHVRRPQDDGVARVPLDESTLSDFLKPELCKIFDAEFVDNDIISRLLGQMEAELMESLRIKAYGAAAAAAKAEEEKLAAFSGKPATMPKPFNLTKPKPRTVLEPMEILRGSRQNPFPIKCSIEHRSSKLRRRMLCAESWSCRDDAQVQGDGRATPPWDEKIPASFACSDRGGALAPCRVQFHAKPAPKFTADAQVKLTAASILRGRTLQKETGEGGSCTQKCEGELK